MLISPVSRDDIHLSLMIRLQNKINVSKTLLAQVAEASSHCNANVQSNAGFVLKIRLWLTGRVDVGAGGGTHVGKRQRGYKPTYTVLLHWKTMESRIVNVVSSACLHCLRSPFFPYGEKRG